MAPIPPPPKHEVCSGGFLLLILFLIIVAMIFCLFGMTLGLASNLNYPDQFVVSPFEEIIAENEPKSTSTCFYPVLLTEYPSSSPCNINNTQSTYYCPDGFVCVTLNTTGFSYGCLSTELKCGDIDDCVTSIKSLSVLEGSDGAARIIETGVSSWEAYIASAAVPVLILILCALIYYHLPRRYSDISLKCGFTMVSGFVLMLLVPVICFIIFQADVGIYSIDYGINGGCFGDEEINAAATTAEQIGFAYALIFMLLLAFSLVFVVAAPFYYYCYYITYKKYEETTLFVNPINFPT